MRHMKRDRDIIRLLGDEHGWFEWDIGCRIAVQVILEVDRSFEICLRNVIVVKECVGCG